LSIDLVFDLGLPEDVMEKFNKEIGNDSWNLSFKSLVMMPSVNEMHCLPATNDFNIAIQDNLEAVDRGLAETEKENRELFLILCMVIVLVSIMFIGYCIYKSMMQKRIRLE
jgi:hypothetical protein